MRQLHTLFVARSFFMLAGNAEDKNSSRLWAIFYQGTRTLMRATTFRIPLKPLLAIQHIKCL